MALAPEDLDKIKLLILELLQDGCEYGRLLYTGHHNLAESMVRYNKRIDTMRDETLPRLFSKVDKIEDYAIKAHDASERAAKALEENQKLIISTWWRRSLENGITVLGTMGGILGILKVLGVL